MTTFHILHITEDSFLYSCSVLQCRELSLYFKANEILPSQFQQMFEKQRPLYLQQRENLVVPCYVFCTVKATWGNKCGSLSQ